MPGGRHDNRETVRWRAISGEVHSRGFRELSFHLEGKPTAFEGLPQAQNETEVIDKSYIKER
ncbi:MAG: hypothetical protein D6680_19065 [Cyanobacteria bacterium J007]|nr:MAG: hypothetical protein D6680_19065 [Cyanobacteria bacterium J007]